MKISKSTKHPCMTWWGCTSRIYLIKCIHGCAAVILICAIYKHKEARGLGKFSQKYKSSQLYVE